MAVTDASICCWKVKYEYNLIRPISYIVDKIDPSFAATCRSPTTPTTPGVWRLDSFPSFDDAAAEAAISRLYGSIHFRPAIERGLTQGNAIRAAINALPLRD